MTIFSPVNPAVACSVVNYGMDQADGTKLREERWCRKTIRVRAQGSVARRRYSHCLKHLVAIPLIEAGADIRFVQDALGHKEIEGTAIFAAISHPERDKRQREPSLRLPKRQQLFTRNELGPNDEGADR